MGSKSILAALILLIPAASSQSRNFTLESRSIDSIPQSIFPLGRGFMTTSEAPVGLTGIPKKEGSQAKFFLLTFGEMEKQDVFHCLFLMKGKRGAGLLYVDRNRNMNLGDEKPIKGVIKKQRYTYEIKNLKIDTGDKEITASFELRADLFGSGLYFFTRNSEYKTGKITLGGIECEIILVDNNANGLFNDSGFSGDRLYFKRCSLEEKYKNYRLAGSRSITLDGTWYYIEPKIDGSTMEYLDKCSDPQEVITAFPSFSLTLSSEKTGTFKVTSKKGKILVPVGEYRLNLYSIKLPGTSFSAGTIMNTPFEVKKGSNKLDICQPIDFQIKPIVRKNTVSFEFASKGIYGEAVYVYTGKGRMEPKFQVRTTSGKILLKSKFEAG